VITDTAAGKRRSARLNVSRSSSDAESSDMVSSTERSALCDRRLNFLKQ